MKKLFSKQLYIRLLLVVGLFFVSSSSVFASAQQDAIDKYCDTWDVNIEDYSGQEHCWSCEIFVLLFDSANMVAGLTNSALGDGAKGIVAVGGGLWFAFYTLMFFSNVGGLSDPMEYLTKIGSIMLRIGIAGVFLSGGASMAFDYIISPVLTSGAKLANIALNASGHLPVTLPNDVASPATDMYNKMKEWKEKDADSIAAKFAAAATAPIFGNAPSAAISGPMGDGVRSALKQMIAAMASGMAQAQAIAQGLRCGAAFYWHVDLYFIEWFFPNPLMAFVGMWLGCVFWGISVMFCFAMLDVIFRIGLLVSMLPIFIAAWVFPITSQFAQSAWKMFLNTVMVFFVTGLTASFIVVLVENAWDINPGETSSFMAEMKASHYTDAWEQLFEQGFVAGLGTLLLVSAVAWWGWLMAPKSDETAKKFVGGSFSSSVAIKAIKKLINFIIDAVMFVLTIVTMGMGACMYFFKVARTMADALDKVQKLREIEQKIKETRKKLQKMRKIQDKMKKVQKGVHDATDKIGG
ncbi:MAG: hypothetical protein IJ752_04135 [Alphaproteobacteria bacterium]|nr:hypothetical protein [Alphaproteobacteria bacterium]